MKNVKPKNANAGEGKVLITEINITGRKGPASMSMKEFKELLRKNPAVLGDEFD